MSVNAGTTRAGGWWTPFRTAVVAFVVLDLVVGVAAAWVLATAGDSVGDTTTSWTWIVTCGVAFALLLPPIWIVPLGCAWIAHRLARSAQTHGAPTAAQLARSEEHDDAWGSTFAVAAGVSGVVACVGWWATTAWSPAAWLWNLLALVLGLVAAMAASRRDPITGVVSAGVIGAFVGVVAAPWIYAGISAALGLG